MKKRTPIVIFCLCLQTLGFTQANIGDLPKIIPPTPNSAAIEKFTTIPVDYSTGIPSISYPFWAWERGRLKFSLGLNYHAGGYKVEDMASNTGLGWALTGIGRVSRTVRGLPDDMITKGFMYTDYLPAGLTYSFNGDYVPTTPSPEEQEAVNVNIAITPTNVPFADSIRQIAENLLDGQQDIFSFSLNGSSGTFIIDKHLVITPLEYTNIKIEMLCTPITFPINGNMGRITAFKMTDDKGLVYKFEYLENQTSTTYSDNFESLSNFNFSEVSSSWLLTKIIDPATKDSVVFSYTTGNEAAEYETGFSQTESWELDHLDPMSYFIIPGLAPASDVTSFNLMAASEAYPDSVLFPDGSKVKFSYDFSRDDLVNSNALTKIKVSNCQSMLTREFQLKYSYFLSGGGTYFPEWAFSDNDFNKRLRLDTIYDISADAALRKATVFTYNSTAINSRDSKNLDYWGYNVNPSRNNTAYVPAIPLEYFDIVYTGGYSAYLEGADRRPDSVYVKAGVLEKIQYPTGGTVNFEYECNRAYSELDYYEDRLAGNTPEWEEEDFGDSTMLYFPGRTKEAVEFIFRTEEFDPRPEPDPEDPQPCFEESQDNAIARFEIRSTDGSFFTYVEKTYGEFIDPGFETVIELPTDKTFRVRFVYDSEATCAFIFPFKAVVSSHFYIAPQDKLAGGLRIKKVTFNDGAGVVLTKQYNYNDTSGHSSAEVFSIPDYGYYRTSRTHLIGLWYVVNQQYINRSSSPTNTVSYHNGSPLIYTRVTETEADGSSTERHFDPFIFGQNGGTGYYPYPMTQYFANLSGLMTMQVIKDKTGMIKNERRITYTKYQDQLLNQVKNRNLKVGTISTSVNFTANYYAVDQNYMYVTRAEEVADTTIATENGNSLTTTQAKTYDLYKFYLRTISTVNSKNEKRDQAFSYSFDNGGAVYTKMIADNMLNYVTDVETYDPDSISGELAAKRSNYALYRNDTLAMPYTVQSSILGNSLETDLTFNAYDDKGNILQYTGKDGIINSFVWGYNKQYPVAKIVGKSYSDAVSGSSIVLNTLNNPSTSDNDIRTELNKLRTLSNCFVSTYTYKPLVGVTSETDPNGKTLYYEYDNFNRLTLIRDKDNYIVKKICYNYSGQPVDCGFGSVAAWQTFRDSCEVSGGVFTGNLVIIEKDMNPSSGTYSQTRNVTIANASACLCNTYTCIGVDKKCIDGVCTTAFKIYTSAVLFHGQWVCTYVYFWPGNCSFSSEYEETLTEEPFLLEPEC